MWNGHTLFIALAIALLITVFYPTNARDLGTENTSYSKIKLFVLSFVAAYAVLYFATATAKNVKSGGAVSGAPTSVSGGAVSGGLSEIVPLDEVMQNIEIGEPEF